ncbi:MAG: class A beta-lactamase [Pseudomonadota bacterium]
MTQNRIDVSSQDTIVNTQDAELDPTKRRVLLSAAASMLFPIISMGCAGRAEEVLNHPGIVDLEARAGGRLGVCILNTENNQLIGNRLDERFGMCSTFKTLLTALILREIERGTLTADQFVPYTEEDMVFYAPVTTKNLVAGGMAVEALAQATQTTSDNVAANLLLDLIEGPAGFTKALRASGDGFTRLDRYETEMNLVPIGEVRDTTTPRAMTASLRHFLLGDGLTTRSQEKLIGWMKETRTGMRRLRAGLPSDWAAGDKTGTGMAPIMVNKYNDVAIAWPPNQAPVIITCYYDAPAAFDTIRPEDEAVLAEVGRLAGEWVTA